MSKRTIPKTKVASKEDRFKSAVNDLITFMELEKGARKILVANKKLTQPIDIRLMIEVNFIVNLLKNMFNVNVSYVNQVVERLHADDDWEEQVEKFANSIVPDASKRVKLFNEMEFKKELMQREVQMKQKKSKTIFGH